MIRSDHHTWKYKTQIAHCQIWENTGTHMIAEAYPIDNYERSHARINRNQKHLVHTLGAVHDNRSNRTFLLIERIPSRLSQILSLNETQSLKVLYSVFKGLEQLQQIYGTVSICQSCVCFNETGHVKIWVNPDLSSLYPAYTIKQHGYNKVKHVLTQTINMVLKKCFNGSFLNNFAQKINQNKISDFRCASDQILKIGQLMFIQINESSNKKLYGMKTGKSTNVNIPQRDAHHNSKIQYENTYKQSYPPHSRKYSCYQPNQPQTTKQHKQGQQNNRISLNDQLLNKFTQSQAFDLSKGLHHKSAPLSPRQNSNSTNKKYTNVFTYEKSNSPSKAANFHKKSESRGPMYLTQTGGSSRNDSTQCDDSFSRSLKIDDKQIIVSGQFQTFGILQDLKSEQSPKPKNYNFSEQKNNNQTQFDIQELDRQIQIILNSNNSTISQQGLNKRIKTSIQRFDNFENKINHDKPIVCSFKKNTKTKINHANILNDIGNRHNNNLLSPSTDKSCSKRDKSARCYLDKKYQEYIQSKKTNHQAKKEQFIIPNRTKHTKHASNLQTINSFHNSFSKNNGYLYRNNHFSNLNLPNTSYMDKGGVDFRPSTQR